MEISVRVEVQYLAPDKAVVLDVLQMFRRPMWVRFMMRYISPRLKTASPAHKSVIESLESEWLLPPAEPQLEPQARADCVICLADTPRSAMDHVCLPCGHEFHLHCMKSWLQLQSTCPICRFQFDKAFAGTYAVHSLVSTILLRGEHRALAREEVLRTSVEKQVVRAVVHVTLVQVTSEERQKEYPCELSALVMHTDGEAFSEYDLVSTISPSECDSPPAATLEDPKSDSSNREQVGAVRARYASACGVRDSGDEADDEKEKRHYKRVRRA